MNKYFKYFTVLLAVTLMFNCEEDNNSELSNFVGFQEGPLNFSIDNGQTDTFDVIVAASEKSSSDRSFNVMVQSSSTLAAPYSVPATVTIPGGSNVGTLSVSVTDNDDLGYVPQSLVLDFPDVAGLNFGDPITLNFVESCLDTIVTFNLTLDTWPDETTWEIYDLNGTPTVIASGGPYVNPDDDFAELSWDFCLASGNYGVVVYDSYGDGGPTFSVTTAAGTLVPNTTVGGTQASATFTVN